MQETAQKKNSFKALTVTEGQKTIQSQAQNYKKYQPPQKKNSTIVAQLTSIWSVAIRFATNKAPSWGLPEKPKSEKNQPQNGKLSDYDYHD